VHFATRAFPNPAQMAVWLSKQRRELVLSLPLPRLCGQPTLTALAAGAEDGAMSQGRRASTDSGLQYGGHLGQQDAENTVR
jgi:hypothetical protein